MHFFQRKIGMEQRLGLSNFFKLIIKNKIRSRLVEKERNQQHRKYGVFHDKNGQNNAFVKFYLQKNIKDLKVGHRRKQPIIIRCYQ